MRDKETAWVAEMVKDGIETDKSLEAFKGTYLRPRLELMTCPKALACRKQWWADDQLCAGPDCADCVLLRTLRALRQFQHALSNSSWAATVNLSMPREVPAPVTPEPAPVTPDVTDFGWTHTCESCGAPFTGVRSDARYCSPACRQRAYRERL